jgi:excisionase family DNA binding protein
MTDEELVADGSVKLNEASRQIGLSVEKLRDLIAAGELRAVKLGSHWLVPRRELVRLLATHMTGRRRSRAGS